MFSSLFSTLLDPRTDKCKNNLSSFFQSPYFLAKLGVCQARLDNLISAHDALRSKFVSSYISITREPSHNAQQRHLRLETQMSSSFDNLLIAHVRSPFCRLC